MEHELFAFLFRSSDPNDKLGPSGYGSAGYLPADGTLAYQIRFENQPSATAPAQRVTVTDPLDPNLDLSTFELTEIAFANQILTVPAGLNHYETRLAFTVTDQTLIPLGDASVFATGTPPAGAMVVEVDARLDLSTRRLTLTLNAVDPITGWAPEDPLAGLLYPNDATGRGDGSISFRVKANAGLDASRIENGASIVFDTNDAIVTPTIFNTLDGTRPVSQVAALPARVAANALLVSWGGGDTGSGIATYTVYYSENGGQLWLPWLERTTLTSALFAAQAGKTYSFYSVAHDNAGNEETAPASADAATYVINPAGRPEIVAAKHDAAPGIADARLLVPGNPAIDASGWVAFRATVAGNTNAAGIKSTNNSGIWLYDGATGTLLARTGQIAPDTANSIFESFGEPVMSANGDVAFLATLKLRTGDTRTANATGVWIWRAGTLHLAVRTGSNAPDLARAKFIRFDQLVLPATGGVAVLAGVSGAGITDANNLGIWATDSSGALRQLMRKGAKITVDGVAKRVNGLSIFAAPDFVRGQSRNIDGESGQLVFSAKFKGGGAAIVKATPTASGFDSEVVAAVGDDDPAGITDAAFAAFGKPIVNGNGSVAYRASIAGTGITPKNNAGIWLHTSAGSSLLARTRAIAPETDDGLFKTLSDPVLNNNDRVAFVGTLKVGTGDTTSANAAGIWSDVGGTLIPVVRTGQDAPEVPGGKFASFDQIVLPDWGGVVMLATLSGVPAEMNQGIWTTDADGAKHVVARTGDNVDVRGTSKTIKSLKIFRVATGVRGQSRNFDAETANLAYQAWFTDGSWAIFRVTH